MTEPVTVTDEPVRLVLYDVTYNERRRCNDEAVSLCTVEHGDNLNGTNPVAMLSGTLCPRKKGCLWCTGLRDRVRSRTVR